MCGPRLPLLRVRTPNLGWSWSPLMEEKELRGVGDWGLEFGRAEFFRKGPRPRGVFQFPPKKNSAFPPRLQFGEWEFCAEFLFCGFVFFFFCPFLSWRGEGVYLGIDGRKRREEASVVQSALRS